MAPKVPSVNNCCCYFELRTGALILGWLDLVVSILGILGGILSLFSDDSSEQERVVLVTESQQIVGETSVLQTIIQIVISAILLPLTVWFLKGIYEKEPKKCFPYIVLQGIELALICLACIVLWPLIFLAALRGYFFVCIYSYYQSALNEGCHASGAGYQSTEYTEP